MAERRLAQSHRRRYRVAGEEAGKTGIERTPTATPLPTGTVTFVLADVEGSVRLWGLRPAEMATATARLDGVVSELVAAHRGVRPVEQGEGDSFVAAFGLARDAVAFILALQRTVRTEGWATALPLGIRLAVHTGNAELRGSGNYMGQAPNRCARIRALAHGGQALLSGAAAALVADDLPDHALLVDLGLHPLRDFDRPEHIFQLAHPDLADRFPPLRDRGHVNPLPSVLTTFVARGAEMTAIGDLLERSRLVTLTGAGGSGKTRLALESAWAHIGRFPDGVAWADAAPVNDGALVASCVADALGVREVGGEPLLDTLVRELREARALVVLDNCEHVIHDVATVVERLLNHCPDLRILATSREPIGVLGESAMRVPSLDEDAAVQLFSDRADAVRPGFALAVDAPAIRDVCTRLDGIPLAIELAASRIRVLSPRQIADGLADRFRLLTGGARTALPRQRTLEASVEWSYRLLSPPERHLLERLSVFAGGFTLEAAQRVCGDEQVSESAVLDLLTALVDKSLVQADVAAPDAHVRYRMLETIRHFARQRLVDDGDGDAAAVRDRHLDYFLAVAEEFGPRLEQGAESEWLPRLDADVDNLRVAGDWAEQCGATDKLIRMAAATWLFWEVRCRFEEGCARLRRAIDASPEPSRARAIALYGLGDMSLFLADIAQMAASGQAVVAMGEALGDTAVVARGTTLLGWAASYGAYRDPTWAVDALGTLLDSLPDDEPWLICDAGIARGEACVAAGDLKTAGAAFDEVVQRATAWRSLNSLQRALFFRGWCHELAAEFVEAEPLLARAVAMAEELDDTFVKALSVAIEGFVRFFRGDLDGAERAGAEACALGDRYRNAYADLSGANVLALVQAQRGEIGEARRTLAPVHPTAAAIGLGAVHVWVEAPDALFQAMSGDVAAARQRLAAASRTMAGGAYTKGVVALFRAWVERLDGESAAAESAASEAAGAFAEAGVRGLAAEALDELGIAAARREQFERAARLFGAADAERTRQGMAPMRWPGLPSREEEAAATRAALGDAVVDAGWREGGELDLDAAIRFALRGKGGRRRPTSGWDSLTPTEREVVRLVSEGLTNPAIAEKLFVTRGTVKVHLSHIFTKLGVASRSELAAEAVRQSAC